MTRPPDFVATLLAGSDDAPPFAALEVTGVTTNAAKIDIYNVRKPTGDGSKPLLFNGPTTHIHGSYGAASNRSHVRGLSGASSGNVGPVNASWSLSASATTKTHRVVGGARSSSYQLERLGGGGSGGDFGFARLYTGMADTDATGLIKNYTPILGAATPGSEPASVGNTNDLEGSTNDVVIVTLTADGWAIAAVLEFSDAEHGFCRPYEDFDSGDATIRPAGYQKVEGIDAPDAGTASVTNPGFSATTGDTLAVAKRSGVWTVCYVIRGSDSELRNALAVLTDDLLTSDPTGSVGSVTVFAGAAAAITSAGNAAGLKGYEGQFVLLREVAAATWEIIAVLPAGARPHGIATLTTALTGSSASITAFRQESGPFVGTPTTVSNPSSFTAAVAVDVDIAYDGSVWNVIDVRGSGIAIAQLDGSLSSGSSTAAIDNFRWLQGNAETAPTSALNPHGISGVSDDVVLLTNRGGAWAIVYKFGGGGGGGGLTPCWITTAATAAPESGGDITAQEVTVYLDTLGATAADRVAGVDGIPAYWDDPDNPITIATGKARRGMVALTTLGTLDVVFAGCTQRDFEP